jgi:hypothetical protein
VQDLGHVALIGHGLVDVLAGGGKLVDHPVAERQRRGDKASNPSGIAIRLEPGVKRGRGALGMPKSDLTPTRCPLNLIN